MPDAITLLKQEHKELKKVFAQFEKLGDSATVRKGELVDRMIELLTAHTYIENECMYPEIRRLLPDLEDDILESYEEHHVADLLVLELVVLPKSAERFAPKTKVLIENVTHHIEEEEEEWFPKVRAALGRNELRRIGDTMAEMREKAPTRPSQPKALRKTIKAALA